jgi:hypothetical protein
LDTRRFPITNPAIRLTPSICPNSKDRSGLMRPRRRSPASRWSSQTT